ncbi:presenilin-like A22 family membrane protease [Methanomicrobium sp. W14]|uniref:presenilin family intramembrane aspartyl protease PSH n=1 Tax=Methanomicrobium sp. W14 TaxID=2817839 RepID=UPI001AE77B1F|nr:presenilin family intramembrane aspartyl protease PSH [Methanomicrobium sp. W14]MBP2133919.1 presenilin-like A22 family membrane protease [Methanomicrobium sp. W14]
MKRDEILPFIAMGIMLVIVQAIALLLSPVMSDAGYTAFEDPNAIENTVYFFAILLIFTAVMLLLIKHKGKKILSWIIGASIFLVFIYIFAAVFGIFLENTIIAAVLTAAFSAVATYLLYKYPEWYVIDILGILICAGSASIFGISLEVFPVIVLLVLLALYDAISVYKTKHMLTLANGVISTKAPILVVIPKTRKYSYIKEGIGIDKDKSERGAFMMGMGDLIMPSILVVSSYIWLEAPKVFLGISIPTLTAVLGSLAGLGLLLYYVAKGNAQAGLPALNGGVILGFLFGCAISGSWDWILGIL